MLDAGWHAHLPRFQGTRLGHVRVESSSCSFPRKLVLTHDVILSPPIGKRIWVGRYNNANWEYSARSLVIFTNCLLLGNKYLSDSREYLSITYLGNKQNCLPSLHTFMKLFCTNTRWFNRSVVRLCWKAPISADTYKCVLALGRLRKLSSGSGGPSLVLTDRGSLLTISPSTWTGGSSTTVAGGIALSTDWTLTWNK